MYEQVGDKVKTLAVFENGVITPRLFRLGGRDYKIKEISLRYQEKSGVSINHYFAIETESGGVFKLSFNDKSFIWKVDERWKDK